jgi:2-amino-4-hydroxy-6-hydroxymethyldihydropteridine diphosphokinase
MNACAYIGLGANLGEAKQTLLQALQTLSTTPGVIACQASRFYSSDPVQATGPVFVNAVARLDTTLSPLNLLDVLQHIEQEHGRTRPYHHAPRTLDLDVLMYDALNLHTPRLTLPHPRMHLRAFVLQPLSDLAPDLSLPVGSVQALLRACREQKIWPLDSGH